MWIAQFYKFVNPRSHLSSGGLGTMGFSIPASIGAACAVKDRPVISISGDGGFQMNLQELITAVAYRLPIKFFIINNTFLGMVRQWQELFHAEKYSFTDLSEANPDFVKLGEALGLQSFRASTFDEVDSVLDEVLAINDRPVLVEFQVVKGDMVFPMVPSGASISNMIMKRLNPKRMV
jgi:acetolactate synthase-1/2/3 large subunit